jgi:hypothetical protein
MGTATRDEALAFVEVLSSGKPLVHLTAVLGHGNVPSVKDFESDVQPAIDRAGELLALLDEYVAALGGLVSRNAEKRDKRVQADKKNSLPLEGLEPPQAADDFEPAGAPAKKGRAVKA